MKSTLLITLSLWLSTAAADITVYTDRSKTLFSKAVQKMEAAGERVTFVEGRPADLIARLLKEDSQASADVVLLNDLVFMTELKRKGIFQALPPTLAIDKVPTFMRDPQNFWVGLTYRVRSAVVDPTRTEDKVGTYQDLADKSWQGRLCMRTSQSAYNEALVAHLMLTYGEAVAADIVAGWVQNLGLPVATSDGSLLESLIKGDCDVAIVNDYYLKQLKVKNPNVPLQVKYLNVLSGGVHSNGAGVAITATTRNASAAKMFVDVLLSEESQRELADGLMVYPSTVRSSAIPLSPTSWQKIGDQVEAARRLMKSVGYQ
jgi:iron(III) transport system substrate-binding protein